MRAFARLASLLFFLGGLIALAACSDENESPPVNPSPPGSDLTVQQLHQMALQETDLPTGFGRPTEGETPREVAGYAQVYRGFVNDEVRRAGTPAAIYSIESWVFQFPSSDRAKAQMDAWRTKAAELPSDKADPALLGLDVRGMIPFGIAANGIQDVLALHAIRQPQFGDQEAPRSISFVALRRDEFIGIVVTAARERHPETAELERVVERAAARLKAQPTS